jgi:hypothetical protein
VARRVVGKLLDQVSGEFVVLLPPFIHLSVGKCIGIVRNIRKFGYQL